MGLAWLGSGPSLLVDMGMEGFGIDGGGDDGVDDSMKMTLVEGVMRGADAKGIGLCHKNGDGNVGNGGRFGDDESDATTVECAWDEMEVTVGGEIITTWLEEEIEIKERVESVSVGARLLLFFWVIGEPSKLSSLSYRPSPASSPTLGKFSRLLL